MTRSAANEFEGTPSIGAECDEHQSLQAPVKGAPNPAAANGHGCPFPRPRRRWKNQPWICECGQGWRLVADGINYASGPVWKWERWPA